MKIDLTKLEIDGWYREDTVEEMVIFYRNNKVVYSGKSEFQRIDIIDTIGYGRMLFLDRIAQSASADEFMYHEMLVHPVMVMHPEPKNIFVLGGSEGATIREVFRYPTVERVVMVDIDEKLVRLCQQYLADWADNAYEDPRLELHFEDGRKYLEEHPEKFDVMIIDLSDPMPDSPALLLFTKEFYSLISDRLTEQGLAVIQGETINPERISFHARLVNTLKAVFPEVLPYPYPIQSFHDLHAHIIVSKKPALDLKKAEERIKEYNLPLRCFSDELFSTLFNLPLFMRTAYEKYTKIITDEDPGIKD